MNSKVLQVAVVGGGAAGFYTAGRLLARHSGVLVDIFERLPTPHGLVRYGVAPDHPEVKNCQTRFEEIANDPRVRLFGNTPIGNRVSVDLLRQQYGGVVMAIGADKDRELGIPGEQQIVSARQFVAWYNGLPEAQELRPDLTSDDTAVIVGHGNVALDCARILLTDPDKLRATDITQQALEALQRNRIRHIHMIGRRGPLQVSFTAKELREMTKIPGLEMVTDRELLTSQCGSDEGKELLGRKRGLKRMMGILDNHTKNRSEAEKTFTLGFLRTPQQVTMDPKTLRCQINQLEGAPEGAKAIPTERITDIPCGLILRSIGYASTPLEGVPFDSRRRIMPNVAGRVTHGKELIEGLYVSGWIKRGPLGVIATTMQDAYRTADALLADIQQGTIKQTDRIKSDQALAEAGVNDMTRVSNEDWKRLAEHEFQRGQRRGKPREKVTNVGEMMRIIKR